MIAVTALCRPGRRVLPGGSVAASRRRDASHLVFPREVLVAAAGVDQQAERRRLAVGGSERIRLGVIVAEVGGAHAGLVLAQLILIVAAQIEEQRVRAHLRQPEADDARLVT